MLRYLHVWFDMDGTLYPISDELDAVIRNRMLDYVQGQKKWQRDRVSDVYTALYFGVKRLFGADETDREGFAKNIGAPLTEQELWTKTFRILFKLDPMLGLACNFDIHRCDNPNRYLERICERSPDWSLDRLVSTFYALYYGTDSHSQSFYYLNILPEDAKVQYDKISIADYVSPDARIVSMFEDLAQAGVPCSVYSNSLPHTINSVLAKLGFTNAHTTYRLSGRDYPKDSETGGFTQLISLSADTHLERIMAAPSGVVLSRRFSPRRLLYVGDREKLDIAPANRAGLDTAIVWAKKRSSTATVALPDVYAVKDFVLSCGYSE